MQSPPPINHHLDRPPPTVLPVGTASDDSISTVATTASSDSTIFPFNRSSSFQNSPYSSLVYTPPARQKDQYIDDEAILSRRFDGLGIRERAEAELAAKRYEEVEAESFHFEEEHEAPPPLPSSISTFAFPNSPPIPEAIYSAPPRHTSLPAIVTSATHFAGLSSTSPIDTHAHSTQSPASVLSSAFPIATSSSSLIGSALSLTPEASPGHSPTISSIPSFPTSASSEPRYLPFAHHRSSTSGSSSISPRTALATGGGGGGGGGMARSGSTPNAMTSSSSLQSPIARSASYMPPWAIATAGNRPGSAGTSSTNRTSSSSTRPWVFDSDASSVCSANSGGWCSGGSGNGKRDQKTAVKEKEGKREDGEEFEGDEGGEVFKAEGDVEFLDHRPEPSGAKLSINRDDPSQVVLKVTLPGFSLDNITVAMRRGHKVHIVADSYGETGGHFEKLIHLGSDVSSVAPRAEFNGTDLNVYIQRRPSRPNSAASTAGSSTNGQNPFAIAPGSPGSTFSSPDLDHRRPSIASSLASAWSSTGSTAEDIGGFSQPPYPLSPSLEYPSPTSSSDPSSSYSRERRISEDIPPPFTVVAPPLTPSDPNYRKSKSSKSLTGPEGAKAAAKAAREEAAKRAKEEAKKLPSSAKGGRRLPFRRQKEDGSFSSGSAGEGSGSGGSASDDGLIKAALQYTSLGQNQPQPQPQSQSQEGKGIDRNGTIKANSRSNSPLPPPALSSSSSSSTDSCISSASTSPNSSPPRNERPLPLFTNPSNPHHTHPRPKMREGNLTLRAPDGMSFVSQAQREWSENGRNGRPGEEEFGEQEGESLTPRWEEKGMKFGMSST